MNTTRYTDVLLQFTYPDGEFEEAWATLVIRPAGTAGLDVTSMDTGEKLYSFSLRTGESGMLEGADEGMRIAIRVQFGKLTGRWAEDGDVLRLSADLRGLKE